MSNFQDILKNSHKLQELFKTAQAEMNNLQVTGVAGAGMVSVIMNGRFQVLKVTIDEEALSEGKAFVEELTAAAMNDAVIKVQEASQGKMSRFVTTLGAPSAFNFSSNNEDNNGGNTENDKK